MPSLKEQYGPMQPQGQPTLKEQYGSMDTGSSLLSQSATPQVTPQTVQPLPFVSDPSPGAGITGATPPPSIFKTGPDRLAPGLAGLASGGFSAIGFDPVTDIEAQSPFPFKDAPLAAGAGTLGQVMQNIATGAVRGPVEFGAGLVDALTQAIGTADLDPIVEQAKGLVKFIPEQLETVGTALGAKRVDPRGEITGISQRTGLVTREPITPTEEEVSGARRELREHPEGPLFAALLGRGVAKGITKRARPKARTIQEARAEALRPVEQPPVSRFEREARARVQEPPTPEQKVVTEVFEAQPKPAVAQPPKLSEKLAVAPEAPEVRLKVTEGESFVKGQIVDKETLLITSAFVPEGLRRQGIFTKLFKEIVEKAKAENPNVINIEGNVISEAGIKARKKFPSTEELLPKEEPPLLRTKIEDVLKPVTPLPKPKVADISRETIGPEEVGTPIPRKPTRSSEAFTKSVESTPGKLVSRDQVVEHFRKTFNLPIRVGKIAKRKALGIFKVRPEVIRSRQANDLNTISHELGHALEKKVYGGIGRKSKLRLDKESRQELLTIGKDLYGETAPKGGFRSEGFAEYMAYWLTTDAAKTVAPKFTKFFEGEFFKANPEIAASLKQGQILIRRYREQGAVDRVYSNIDMTGKLAKRPLKERLEDGILRINTLFADDLAPLEFVEKRIRGLGRLETLDPKKIDPITSPTMIARAVAMTAESKAREMILHGTFTFSGKTTGKSLREVIAPVIDNVKDAVTYAYGKRAIELHKRGINPGITLEDARVVVKDLKSAKNETFAKELTAYDGRVIDYLVESGGMSREAANVMIALNPSHVSLKRAIGKSFVSTGGKKLADLQSPIKRIKGSGLPIQNILESTIENTAAIISFADKTRVGKALVELSEKNEATGRWVEKIPAPIQSQRVSIESMAKQLKEAGVDLSGAKMDEVLTVYSNAGLYKGRDNIVSFVRDGKREFYEIDSRLYATLKAIDAPSYNVVIRIMSYPTRAVRLGATGLNPGFSIFNAIRDGFALAIQTEYGTGIPALTKAFFSRMSPTSPANLRFKRSGADLSQFLALDKKQLKKAIDEVMASDAKRKALNVVRHPIEAARELFSFVEALPRIAEGEGATVYFERIYGENSVQAAIARNLAASEASINFRRAGTIGRSINQISAFWNARLQGALRMGRFARQHPVKFVTKGTAYVTAPTLALWWMNKDEDWYKEMPAWQKFGFWNIHMGTNKDGSPFILRIPRPFEYALVFGAIPEMMVDYQYRQDPEVVKAGLKHIYEQTTPIGPQAIPTALKIPIEQIANYDFFRDRPIDPFFEVRHKDPEDRFSPYTTETAKFIGKQFGMSPRRIDHLVRGSTGGLGLDVIKAGERVAGISPPETDLPANIPVVGRLFARTETPERRKRRIGFEKKEKEEKIKRLIVKGNLDDARSTIILWNKQHPKSKLESFTRLRFEAVKRESSRIRKDKSLSLVEKKTRIREIRRLAGFSTLMGAE